MEDSYFDPDAPLAEPHIPYRNWKARKPDLMALPVIHPSRSLWEILAGTARPQGLGLRRGWARAVADDFRSKPLQATLEGRAEVQGRTGRNPAHPLGGDAIAPKGRR